MLRLWSLAPLLLAFASPASALGLDLLVDGSVTPAVGSPAPLSGSISVQIGDYPNAATTTFDAIDVDVLAGEDLLSLASPGLGVLSAAGTVLFPTLQLVLTSGGMPEPLTLVNLSGTFGPDCEGRLCLQTSFDLDGPDGLVPVSLTAIPEPTTAALLVAGLALAACVRRNAS